MELVMKIQTQEAAQDAAIELILQQPACLRAPLSVVVDGNGVRCSADLDALVQWFESPQCAESLEVRSESALLDVTNEHAGILVTSGSLS